MKALIILFDDDAEITLEKNKYSWAKDFISSSIKSGHLSFEGSKHINISLEKSDS